MAESRRMTTMEPDQKPAALDGSPADAQDADYNNDEGHATYAPMGASAVKCWRPLRNLFACQSFSLISRGAVLSSMPAGPSFGTGRGRNGGA